jgi:signal transduction histidine kinase
MKQRHFGIFRRITIMVFTLTAALGALFILITYLAAMHFYQASTQLLNKDVAAHIAMFTSPFEDNGLNKQKADSVFQNAMVISPSAEVYFLDTTGMVMYFHASPKDIKRWHIPLGNIHRYIASGGKLYIKNDDPRDPDNERIFSAAVVNGKAGKLGYIYVIFGSSEYRNATQMLYKSHVGNLALEAFIFIIIISAGAGFLYVNNLQKRFTKMIRVLERFQNGDFEARLHISEKDEMGMVAQSFNKMADQLVYNIHRLTNSEQERKNLIVNISHDLRTPLSVARGYTETLLIKRESKEISEQEQTEYISLIISKIQQVENMVRQLFDLSKMESAAFEFQKEPFIFSEVLQELVKAFALSAAEKQIQIECMNCTDASWINADIRLMERVIQNLVVNAVSYTPKEGKIRIMLERTDEELVFTIDNEGPPLPDDLIRWLNASEENNTVKKPSKSTIGLSIVKRILYLHEYAFEVKKESGYGNRFSFHMMIYQFAD